MVSLCVCLLATQVQAVQLLQGACVLGRFIYIDADPDSRGDEGSGQGNSQVPITRRQRRAHLQLQHVKVVTDEQVLDEAKEAAPAPVAAPARRPRGRYLG